MPRSQRKAQKLRRPRAVIRKTIAKVRTLVPTRVRTSRTRAARPRNALSAAMRGGDAPLAVSRSGRSQISYSSVSAGGLTGLRVSACIPICEIGNDPQNNGFYVQGSGTSPSPGTATTCALSPYELYSATALATGTPPLGYFQDNWISPHLPLLAIAFDRYRMESLSFHYEPQSAATTEDRLVFAWTDDPAHPFLSPNGISAATVAPSQLQLLVTKDSVAFMPWKEWSMSVPVSKDMRFLYSEAYTASLISTPRASARQEFFGCMSCVGSAAPTLTQYGVLYVSVVMDLFDPVPIVSSINSLISTSLSARAPGRTYAACRSRQPDPHCDIAHRFGGGGDSKEEKKISIEKHSLGTDSSVVKLTQADLDEEDFETPPRYKPLPSCVPGAPAYTPRTISLTPEPSKLRAQK